MFKKIAQLGILSFVVVVIVVVAGMKPTESAENKVVVIGCMTDISGPYAPMMVDVEKQRDLCIKWINKTKFIPGVELRVEWLDHGLDMKRIIAGYKKLVGLKPKPLIIITNSTGEGEALKKMFEEDQVVNLCGGTSFRIARPPGWVFCQPPQYIDQLAGYCKWIKANWKEKRNPRFALLSYDNTAGRSPISEESKAYMKKLGIDYVGDVFIPPTPVETTAQVIQLQNNKADFTFGVIHESPLSVFLKDARRLGLQGKVNICSAYAFNPYMVVNYAGEAAEGVLSTQIYGIRDEVIPSKPYKEIGVELPTTRVIFNAHHAWTQYLTVAEAIKIVIRNVGDIEKATGRDMKMAMESMKDFDPAGFASRVSFSKTDRNGISREKMVKIVNGKPTIISDMIELPNLLEIKE